MSPDFEFRFGKDRSLRGEGWRGLAALALLLAALVVMLAGTGAVEGLLATLSGSYRVALAR